MLFFFLKAPVEDSVSSTVETKPDPKKTKVPGVSSKAKVCYLCIHTCRFAIFYMLIHSINKALMV